MSTKHTPTPWRTRSGKEAPDDLIVFDKNGYSICDCAPGTPEMRWETGIANAAFIVLAVNSHAALVEALRSCARILPTLPPKDGCLGMTRQEILNIHAALTAAGEP